VSRLLDHVLRVTPEGEADVQEALDLDLMVMLDREEPLSCQSGHYDIYIIGGEASGPCSTIARWLWMCPRGPVPICDARRAQLLARSIVGRNHHPCNVPHDIEAL
jgi:hypothetical protein